MCARTYSPALDGEQEGPKRRVQVVKANAREGHRHSARDVRSGVGPRDIAAISELAGKGATHGHSSVQS